MQIVQCHCSDTARCRCEGPPRPRSPQVPSRRGRPPGRPDHSARPSCIPDLPTGCSQRASAALPALASRPNENKARRQSCHLTPPGPPEKPLRAQNALAATLRWARRAAAAAAAATQRDVGMKAYPGPPGRAVQNIPGRNLLIGQSVSRRHVGRSLRPPRPRRRCSERSLQRSSAKVWAKTECLSTRPWPSSGERGGERELLYALPARIWFNAGGY
eukprot:361005-Chlamydomonas_euryale.AAC.9